jgi:hypothetical protein
MCWLTPQSSRFRPLLVRLESRHFSCGTPFHLVRRSCGSDIRYKTGTVAMTWNGLSRGEEQDERVC